MLWMWQAWSPSSSITLAPGTRSPSTSTTRLSQSAVLDMGVDALVLSFIVVVIGGLGSLEGALVGALIVGVVREAGIAWFPEIELAVLYLMAAAVLLVRPAGLFGRAT